MADKASRQTARGHPRTAPEVGASGSQNGHSSRTMAYLLWEDMGREEQLGHILRTSPASEWLDEPYLPVLTHFRPDPIQWAKIIVAWRDRHQHPREIENAVDQYAAILARADGVIPPECTIDPFVFTDVRSILAHPPQPRRWLLPGIIADGLTLLGGSPKGGKTYLAYALALAVSYYGRWCNHWEVEQGKVLYITLEDDENDTHLRLLELDPSLQIAANRLLFVHGQDTLPDFGNGLRGWLEAALKLHKPRLMIIDPISYLYVLKKTGSQFEETKDMLFPLQWLGKTYQCAIVCLDHRRKRSTNDVSMVDTLYGSVAKQAVPSGIIMVNRDQNDIELDMTIRNGQQQKEYVSFTFASGRCFLEYKGGEKEVLNHSELRMRVLDVLQASPIPMTIADVLLALALPDTRQERNIVFQILYRAMKTREIEKTSRGRYVASTRDDE